MVKYIVLGLTIIIWIALLIVYFVVIFDYKMSKKWFDLFERKGRDD